MCAGLARKVNRMPFDGGARGVAPLLFFWGNVPSSGLASSGEGASPFFTVKKRPDSLVHENLTIKLAWRQRTWRKNVKWIKYSNGSQTICPEGFLGRARGSCAKGSG